MTADIQPTELRLFRAVDTFEVQGRGRLYLGPCPFRWDTQKQPGLTAWEGRWLISHPQADHTKTYRVKAVERHLVFVIPEGQRVGLLVEPHEADRGRSA